MARKRKISTDDILDATERAVTRHGAAVISINAVAQEAGVSKSRVVYDYKTKRALLEALLERHLDSEIRRIEAAVAANQDSPHPGLFGRIAVAEIRPDDLDRAVSHAIGSAMANEHALRQQIRDWTRADIKAVGSTDRPQAALLAYLALMGFTWSELSGAVEWTETERTRILAAIRTIFTSFPQGVGGLTEHAQPYQTRRSIIAAAQ